MFIACILALSGCASDKNIKYGAIWDDAQNGSYVQWNEEYAVTAAHFKNKFKGSEYASTKVDVQFLRKQSVNFPAWSHHKNFEHVTMTGYPTTFAEKSVQGQVSGHTIKHWNADIYPLVAAVIIPGMSGGPVFNAAGQVVGINVGYTLEPMHLTEKPQIFSLFLPYGEIQKEWVKFMLEKQTMASKDAAEG